MLKCNFSQEEKNFLTYIYLMNSCFKSTPRYFLKQSWKVLDNWEEVGLNLDTCILEIVDFIFNNDSKGKNIENIFKSDIFWYLSFYSDLEFLRLYRVSSKAEKEDLQNETVEDYKNANIENVASYKYKSTNFSRPMLINTLLIIYLSKLVKDFRDEGLAYTEFYEELLKKFSEIYQVNADKVLDFIFSNESVFRVIYENAISMDDDFSERYVRAYKKKNKEKIDSLLKEKIDTTSQEGLEKLEVVRQVLKKLAKEKSNYRCFLEEPCSCSYFTSKEEHKNYLEIHHFIPREFSYNFEDTIEIVENYIPLCPNCHRKIHKAEDRERISLINFLFARLHVELQKHNIKISLKEIYEFYKIDDQ